MKIGCARIKLKFVFLFLAWSSIFLASCGNPSDPRNNFQYDIVFPQNKVNRIDIVIASSDWDSMLEDMREKYGVEFGTGDWSDSSSFWDEFWPTIEWPEDDPVWVTCSVVFEGQRWDHVGIRFKGASTLLRAWWGGSYKLPFKLDFDQFEDEHPFSKNQRFYGFKKLGFTNNISDESYLNYKVTADLFREEGVPSPHAAHYRVFIDKGEGPQYFGIYTVVEYPQRSLFYTQFGDTGGNLYKPYGISVEAWRRNIPVDSESFPKKNNEDSSDWGDVQKAVDALNADRDDPESWRTSLEEAFDVTSFIRWLAVNAVILNVDVSGNHYLYGDPAYGGRIGWIAWDFDSSFPSWNTSGLVDDWLLGPLTLDYSGIDENCPLVRYILDDEFYWSLYRDYVRAFAEGNFGADSLKKRFEDLHELISPYVIGDEGELPGYSFTDSHGFEDRMADTFDFIDERHIAIEEFLED